MQQVDPSVAELMRSSGVEFGTSGARGLVTAMTDRVCHGYVTGFLQYMKECGAWAVGSRVALAGDLRPSSPRILTASAQAVRDLGGDPVFCGYVPTPALAHWAFTEGIPSIMVTGSHIPDDRNGIKFYRPGSEFLKNDEPGMARQRVGPGECEWDEEGALINPAPLPKALDIAPGYIARYVDFFGIDALQGLRIGVYQHSAVGRDILCQVLEALGAEVLPLGRSEIFIPVDTEAIRAEDIALARQWVAEQRLDAIASTDGDADRPLLAGHTGEWLRGDVLGVICARALAADCVVTPVSSNTVVEECGAFSRVYRTRIGSPYVIAQMDAALAGGEGVVCGYEANGGFLLASDAVRGSRRLAALPTRDAVLPIVAALKAARPDRLLDIVSNLPPRFTFSQRLQDFAPVQCEALMAWLLADGGRGRDSLINDEFGPIAGAEIAAVSLVDGVRMTFSNGRIIHLRGSGNAPELRCYSEAERRSIAEALSSEALTLVSKRFVD